MSADQVFVLVIVLGVAALLIWVELNYRRRASGESNSAQQAPQRPDDASEPGQGLLRPNGSRS